MEVLKIDLISSWLDRGNDAGTSSYSVVVSGPKGVASVVVSMHPDEGEPSLDLHGITEVSRIRLSPGDVDHLLWSLGNLLGVARC